MLAKATIPSCAGNTSNAPSSEPSGLPGARAIGERLPVTNAKASQSRRTRFEVAELDVANGPRRRRAIPITPETRQKPRKTLPGDCCAIPGKSRRRI
jgi:hypothetical protein